MLKFMVDILVINDEKVKLDEKSNPNHPNLYMDFITRFFFRKINIPLIMHIVIYDNGFIGKGCPI